MISGQFMMSSYVTGTRGSDNFPGTMAQPFKTLTHARDVIRQLKNTSGEYVRTTAIMLLVIVIHSSTSQFSVPVGLPEGGLVVFVRGGDYAFVDAPFTLQGEQDSGKEGSPIM